MVQINEMFLAIEADEMGLSRIFLVQPRLRLDHLHLDLFRQFQMTGKWREK